MREENVRAVGALKKCFMYFIFGSNNISTKIEMTQWL